jgi:hypothetical protein
MSNIFIKILSIHTFVEMILGFVSCLSTLDVCPWGVATPTNNKANKITENLDGSSRGTARIKERRLQAVVVPAQ